MGDRGQKNVSTCGMRSLCPSCVTKTDKPVLLDSSVAFGCSVSRKSDLTSEAHYRHTTSEEVTWLNEMTNGVSVDKERLILLFMP